MRRNDEMEHTKRTKEIKILVSPEERNLIEQKMKIAGFNSMGAYIRKMAIDGFTVNIDHSGIARNAVSAPLCRQ